MKINPASGYETYQSMVQAAKGEAQAKEKVGAKAPARSDKVTLSENAAAKAELSRLSSALAAEVDAPATAERLSGLHAAVQDGSYHVSSEDIADAILSINA